MAVGFDFWVLLPVCVAFKWWNSVRAWKSSLSMKIICLWYHNIAFEAALTVLFSLLSYIAICQHQCTTTIMMWYTCRTCGQNGGNSLLGNLITSQINLNQLGQKGHLDLGLCHISFVFFYTTKSSQGSQFFCRIFHVSPKMLIS